MQPMVVPDTNNRAGVIQIPGTKLDGLGDGHSGVGVASGFPLAQPGIPLAPVSVLSSTLGSGTDG
jgi:hypothetical protein